MQHSRTKAQGGFTLVEMMVIAPLVILLIGLFITYIVTTTGESAKQTDKNAISYEIQGGLNIIEEDANRAVDYLSSVTSTNTEFPISNKQGSDEGTAGYSANSNHLLMKMPATTNSSFSDDRSLVYLNYPDSSCDVSTITLNDSLYYLVAYFVRDGSLWRRVIMGSYGGNSLCSGYTPWQQATCSPTTMAGSPPLYCKATDVELVENVSSFTTNYYATVDASTPISAPYNWQVEGTNASEISPLAIETTISVSKSVAGSTITDSASLRVSSINIR